MVLNGLPRQPDTTDTKSDPGSNKPVRTYFTLTHMKTVIGKVPTIITRDMRTRIQPKHPSLPEFLSAETLKCVARSALQFCSNSIRLAFEDACFVHTIKGNMIQGDENSHDNNQGADRLWQPETLMLVWDCLTTVGDFINKDSWQDSESYIISVLMHLVALMCPQTYSEVLNVLPSMLSESVIWSFPCVTISVVLQVVEIIGVPVSVWYAAVLVCPSVLPVGVAASCPSSRAAPHEAHTTHSYEFSLWESWTERAPPSNMILHSRPRPRCSRWIEDAYCSALVCCCHIQQSDTCLGNAMNK